MTHDIIDNRKTILIDNIRQILSSTESARFAVGYFFLSGLESISQKLSNIKELRLLIGNTTNRETLEQIAEGYRRLELVKEHAEAEAYPKRTRAKEMRVETTQNLREAVELMDQTDEGENLIKTLIRMIQEKRLKVRVYTKGRLHAKAYIFDYGTVYDNKGKPVDRHEKGIAIVGSSNLTLSGVTHNTELNVVVHGNENHDQLGKWFEELWEEAHVFDESLIKEMKQSWAVATVRPYDIYMKTLYALVKDRIEGGDEREILWDDEIIQKLADFQKVAVRQVIQIIKDYGGGFVSDVVGMGKSFVGAAIVKHFERTNKARPLIICPATLVEMWEKYNEVYQLNANVLSMGYLRENKNNVSNILKENVKYRDRDFILVDESHNFRNSDTQRYKLLQGFLETRKKCCFLTATPRNKSAWDIYNQIKLFHRGDITDMPVDPPNLKEYFKLVEEGGRELPALLSNILYRRTRNHILKWYGYDSKTHQRIDPSRFEEYKDGRRKAYILVAGKHQYFPKRELETIEYSIEETYQGLYHDIRNYLGKPRKRQPASPPVDQLRYARYGLWHYVDKEKRKKEPYASLKRAGMNLSGLVRILLFKRFESSVYAFHKSVKRLLSVHERFLEALEAGMVPAGDEAQQILYEPNMSEEQDLMDALRKATDKYNVDDFNIELLKKHIEHDIGVLKKIIALVEDISPEKDAKLQVLLKRLSELPLKDGKRLIFTQYADTARYLFDTINPNGEREDIDVIYSGDKSKMRVVGRFAPKANPEYNFPKGEEELFTVVATDVLAEGLNLQDCDKVINYDLHWNPVRLIQRFGRIDRIGSEHDVIYGYNFLPETGLEKELGIKGILKYRIQEIHATIGEDSAILDKSERLNEEAMYAIYEKKGGQLDFFETEEDLIDLNEAEEMLRQLRNENPEEFKRITELRDGIRTGKPSVTKQFYVFCQADKFQQLFLLDEKGKDISRDIPKILGMISCAPDLDGVALPKGYNEMVMRVQRLFAEEVKHRHAERKHSLYLTPGQKYVLRELRILFEATKDEEVKARINILESAFRASVTVAINKELNRIRKNGIIGDDLLRILSDLYFQHNMKDMINHRNRYEEKPIPRIICSEALL